MPTQESTLRVGVDSRQGVKGLTDFEKKLGKVGREAEAMEGRFGKLAGKTKLLAGAFATLAGISLGAVFSQAVTQAGAFETKLAEVSTLVDTATFKLGDLEDSIKASAVAFGQNAVNQTAAAYQIISAGASTAAEATDILTASNKLAVGGVTDVATAADGLTSVLNAYGLAASQAADVSDALFIGVKAGKTTVGELSSSLGKVAPLAANAGVSFDELVSSVAALTKGGISTQESVTGVRAILAAVVKPTKEAADQAAALGIDFNAAGLKAKGFAGFMEEVVSKTGGSSDALAQLFGGVEALVPALALAGQAGVDMTNILEDMETKSGATQEAFDKLSNTFEFQANRVRQGLNNALISLGSIITTALTPALKFLADNFETVGTFLKTFGTLLAIVAVPALLSMVPAAAAATASLVGMAAAFALTPFGTVLTAITAISAALTFFGSKMIEVSGYTVTVWDAVRAAVQTVVDIYVVLRDRVSEIFSEMTVAAGGFFSNFATWLPDLSGLFTDTWNFIGEATKTLVNAQIGLFVGLVAAIGPSITEGIPALFALAYGGVKNATLSVVEFIVNKFAGLFGAIGDGLAALPGVSDDLGNTVRNALTVDLGDAKADIDTLRTAVTDAGNSITTAFGNQQRDYVGDFAGTISTIAAPAVDMFNENLRELSEVENEATNATQALDDALEETTKTTLPELGSAAGGAKDKVKELKDELQRPVTAAEGLADGFAQIAKKVKTEGEIVSSAIVQTFDGVTNSIVEFAKTGKLNIQSLAASVAQSVLKMTTELLLLKALRSTLGGFGFGFSNGGLVEMATGGMVRGIGTGTSDSIPAMLSNGEFVVNAAATKDFLPVLNAINSGKMRGFAAGGLAANTNTSLSAPAASESSSSAEGSSQPTQINVISTIADRDVAAAINNPEGEQVILNMLSRNKNKLQGIVNG